MVVRISLAVVLLVAAARKGYQLATGPLLGDGLLASRPVLIALVEFEWVLGLCMLFGLYLQGERVLLSPQVISVTDESPSREWDCTIWNLQRSPLKVFGATADCPCITIAGCPATIDAGDSRVFAVSANKMRPGVTYRVVFFSDDTVSPHLMLEVRNASSVEGAARTASPGPSA